MGSLLLMGCGKPKAGTATPFWVAGGAFNYRFDALGVDGAAVASVVDSDGGNTATQNTTANKPTYNASVINGHGAVSGNGSSTVLIPATPIVFTDQFTFYCILVSSGAGHLLTPAGGASQNSGIQHNSTALFLIDDTVSLVSKSRTPPTGADWFYIRRDGAGDVYMAGVNLVESLAGNLPGTITIESLLARPAGGAFSDAIYKIAELKIYSTSLSVGNIASNYINYIQPTYGF